MKVPQTRPLESERAGEWGRGRRGWQEDESERNGPQRRELKSDGMGAE